MQVDRHLDSDCRRVVGQHEVLDGRMAIFRALGQQQAQLRQGLGVRLLSNEPQREMRQIAVGASGTVALLEEIVRAVLRDVPEVSADLWEPTLAEQVRLQPMERELVLLLMIEGLGVEGLIGRQREPLAQPGERADRRELTDPCVNRAGWHPASGLPGNVRARLLERSAEVVRGQRAEDRRRRILSTRNW